MFRLILFTVFVLTSFYFTCFSQVDQTCKVPLVRNSANLNTVLIAINDFEFDAILDPGATMVSIGYNMYIQMVKSGLIDSAKSFKGLTTTKLADGRSVQAYLINIDSIKVCKATFKDVECMVIKSDNAFSLVGQSLLRRFSSYSISNDSSFMEIKYTIGTTPTVVPGIPYGNNVKNCTGVKNLIDSVRLIACNDGAKTLLDSVQSDLDKEISSFCIAGISQEIIIPKKGCLSHSGQVSIVYFETKKETLSKANALKNWMISFFNLKPEQVILENYAPRYPQGPPSKDYFEIWIK